MTREIVLLANSLKNGGRCVAGKCLRTGEWVRPVADVDGGALDPSKCRVRNPRGDYAAKPLQKALIPLVRHCPLINQPENHLVGDGVWQQRFKIEKGELVKYLDHPTSLWGAGDHVSYADIAARKVDIPNSLYLVKVDDLKLHTRSDGKRRAIFSYGGNVYDLACTDPGFDDLLKSEKPLLGIVCVSLAEPWGPNSECYKLVATLF